MAKTIGKIKDFSGRKNPERNSGPREAVDRFGFKQANLGDIKELYGQDSKSTLSPIRTSSHSYISLSKLGDGNLFDRRNANSKTVKKERKLVTIEEKSPRKSSFNTEDLLEITPRDPPKISFQKSGDSIIGSFNKPSSLE